MAGLVLAATWNPRGEFERFTRLFPLLKSVYAALAVVLPPRTAPQEAEAIRGFAAQHPELSVALSPEWPGGRYWALQQAHGLSAEAIQYADMDRLLRWAETRPGEWQALAEEITRHDCLVIGRTPAAYATHPRALVHTEALSNRVISHLLGRCMDVSAGSKGFGRRAVACLLANCRPHRALGADGEWPVILRRAGFPVGYREVEGLDWESADRYQGQAADGAAQRRAAEAYDADPSHWARRVEVADEIITAGLEAFTRPLVSGGW